MTPIKGKAKDLDLKPGDVVKCVDDGDMECWTKGKNYAVTDWRSLIDDDGDDWLREFKGHPSSPTFRVVHRAARPYTPGERQAVAEHPETPTLWRDMTPEQKAPIALHALEGGVVQMYGGTIWLDDESFDPAKHPAIAYRIKPAEPKTVTLYGTPLGLTETQLPDDTHSITMPVNAPAGIYTREDGGWIEVKDLTND